MGEVTLYVSFEHMDLKANDTFAIVHRKGAVLSPAARLMIELATTRMQEIAEATASRHPATPSAT